MILRRTALRRTRLRPSRGTVIPSHVRNYVHARDMGCVGPRVGMEGECAGYLTQDHVRASGALGRKSPSEPWNVADLCQGHHRFKTEHGREVRPLLIDYLLAVEGPPPEESGYAV